MIMQARNIGILRSVSHGARAVALMIPLVLAGSVSPASAQVRCGDTIGPGQEVILSSDLECGDVGVGLIVTGPAVLDLNGFAVSCPDSDRERAISRVGI